MEEVSTLYIEIGHERLISIVDVSILGVDSGDWKERKDDNWDKKEVDFSISFFPTGEKRRNQWRNRERARERAKDGPKEI
jgi:hypothetical protein